MKRFVMVVMMLALAGLGCRKPETSIPQPTDGDISTVEQAPSREEPIATFFEVHTNERIQVGAVAIEIREISSLTAQGCQGGPIGCPDNVELNVAIPGNNQTFRLVVLGGSTASASSERLVFGHRVILSSVTADSATIGVFIAQNPTITSNPSDSGPSANPAVRY